MSERFIPSFSLPRLVQHALHIYPGEKLAYKLPHVLFLSREGRAKCQKPSPAKGQKRKLPEEKESSAEKRGNIDHNNPGE